MVTLFLVPASVKKFTSSPCVTAPRSLSLHALHSARCLGATGPDHWRPLRLFLFSLGRLSFPLPSPSIRSWAAPALRCQPCPALLTDLPLLGARLRGMSTSGGVRRMSSLPMAWLTFYLGSRRGTGTGTLAAKQSTATSGTMGGLRGPRCSGNSWKRPAIQAISPSRPLCACPAAVHV